jgi:two-component system sensor histidine kinase KdpD
MMRIMNGTTVALLLLLVVLVVATVSTRAVAIAASLVAFAAFNFFFLPPVGTFAIARSDDVVALFTLLAVGLVVSHLSHLARRRAQEALTHARARQEADVARRSLEARSALVASLSHDLKTPLTALTVAAGNLGDADLSADARIEQRQIVQSELQRLKRLFENVVEMASVEARALHAESQWVDASEIVEVAVHHADAILASHNVRVADETGELVVYVDPRLVSAALAHVLENAAAYSPAPSTIEIGVSVRAGMLVLTVRDRGPGLSAQDLEHIFDRSYRGRAGVGSDFSSGMGLAITRGLLTIHGGRVRAANHPEGGAVFTLEVPTPARARAELPADLL